MKKPKKITFLCLILCFGFSAIRAQQVFKTTPASVIGYLEYVPEDYNNNSNKYPIVIFLHGIGERGANSTDPAVISTTIQNVAKLGPPALVKNGTQFPFILISPQLKNNYGTWPAWYVMEIINYVKTYLRIDEKRIYLTGLSLGGGGVWVTAQDFPEFFAAIAPVCGGYNTPSKACNIAGENLPVWAFHGDSDSVVPMSKTVNMVNAINNCTPTPSPLAKVTIYPGVGHSAWSKAYKNDHTVHNPNVYDWMTSLTNKKNNGNNIPSANAGSDLTKSLVTTINLTGSATDTDGTISAYSWKQLSGPTTATLTNSLTKTVSSTGLAVGVYMFSFQVTDNSGNTDTDYVKLTVTTPNIAPVANAGADQSVTLPTNAVSINGSASDPDGTVSSVVWTKVSGGAASLAGTTTCNLTASNLVSGNYTFRLTVTDNKGAKKSDDVAVIVTGVATNVAPVANSGANKVITLPTNSVTIYGNGTDADGTITKYQWTKTKGGVVNMAGATTPTLVASGMVAGAYVFRLTVTDDRGATHYDAMLVTVKSPVLTSSMITTENSDEDNTIALKDAGEFALDAESRSRLLEGRLKDATVIIFDGSGEKIYTGSWNEDTYREVMNRKGLYLYNIIREGKRTESGKIYVRD